MQKLPLLPSLQLEVQLCSRGHRPSTEQTTQHQGNNCSYPGKTQLGWVRQASRTTGRCRSRGHTPRMPGNTGRVSAKHFRKATLRRSIQYPSPPYESSHAQRPSPAPRTHPAGLGANYQISQKKAKSPFHGSSCLLSPERSSVPQPSSHPATANPTDSLSPSRHLLSTLPALAPGTTDAIPSVQAGQQTKSPPRPAGQPLQGFKETK